MIQTPQDYLFLKYLNMLEVNIKYDDIKNRGTGFKDKLKSWTEEKEKIVERE